MKKLTIILLFLLGVTSSCKKTSSSSSTSTYSSSSSIASPSLNTSVNIGGAGWSFGSCVAGPTLTAIKGIATSELVFPSNPINAGIYSITQGVPSPGQVRLRIIDPPGQPSGYQWYSSVGSQTISVVTTTFGAIIATFNNITCTQTTSSTPIVTATGTMVCQ